MRAFFAAAVAASIVVANAFAQAPQAPASKQVPPAASEPSNPAVKGHGPEYRNGPRRWRE